MFRIFIFTFFFFVQGLAFAQYHMPEENALHEGTWLQWPHNVLYGPWYQDDVEPTFIGMVRALEANEKVHIIALNATEQARISTVLTNAGVSLTNIDFQIYTTDDVWVRDNGPIFVYDSLDNLVILDWGFNGWGNDTPFSNCDVIPQSVSNAIGIPRIDLSAMVLEGGAIEHDGNGTMMATRTSVTHSSRNPGLTEAQIEDYMADYLGFTKFIWLDGVYGQEITDMHIDGVMKFANDSTIITMNNADLLYWGLTQPDIDTLFAATNTLGDSYNFITIPLTQNDVSTTIGTNLGYKGSYANYYIANGTVLVPTYNDPNDAVAISIIQSLYPNRTVAGIDVRNIYEYGGMIHCITQQQPSSTETSIEEFHDTRLDSKHYPSPYIDQMTVTYHLKKTATLTFSIHGANGDLIVEQIFDSVKEGEHNIEINRKLAPGMYTYTLKCSTGHFNSEKFIVVRS